MSRRRRGGLIFPPKKSWVVDMIHTQAILFASLFVIGIWVGVLPKYEQVQNWWEETKATVVAEISSLRLPAFVGEANAAPATMPEQPYCAEPRPAQEWQVELEGPYTLSIQGICHFQLAGKDESRLGGEG